MTHHTCRADHVQHRDLAHSQPLHQLHGSPAGNLGDQTHWLDTQAEHDRWLILYGDAGAPRLKV